MNQENKIITEYLKTYYIGALIFLGIAGATTYVTADNIAKQQDIPFEEQVDNSSLSGLYFLSAILVTLCLIMAYFGSFHLTKNAKREASRMAFVYFDSLMKQHPELKQFEAVLKNRATLIPISTQISNALGEEETNRILALLKEISKSLDKSEYDYKNIVKDTEKQIVAIVMEHTKKDPEFYAKVFSIVSSENMRYMAKQSTIKEK